MAIALVYMGPDAGGLTAGSVVSIRQDGAPIGRLEKRHFLLVQLDEPDIEAALATSAATHAAKGDHTSLPVYCPMSKGEEIVLHPSKLMPQIESAGIDIKKIGTSDYRPIIAGRGGKGLKIGTVGRRSERKVLTGVLARTDKPEQPAVVTK